jgi:hypothetical protein
MKTKKVKKFSKDKKMYNSNILSNHENKSDNV